MVLYGTQSFLPSLFNNIDSNKINKTKTTNSLKKKNIKKQKNKMLTTKPPKIPNKLKAKHTTPRYFFQNITNVSYLKNKKLTKPTTEYSPYFYAINNSKYKTSEESVRQYLKFVKNITITYPVMIPARDISKPFKKSQKQKEKSRDINSNRNSKVFTVKPPELTTVVTTTTSQNGKKLGN